MTVSTWIIERLIAWWQARQERQRAAERAVTTAHDDARTDRAQAESAAAQEEDPEATLKRDWKQ